MSLIIRTPQQMLDSNMLVKHYAGSRAYGTSLPTSDIDIRGVYVADHIYYRSPWHNNGECSVKEDEDTKFYELSKFMQLVVDQNPNIVETLWISEEDIILDSPEYHILRENRDKLLSSKAAFTYTGYAHSQMKRIKGHNKWINNPKPIEPPRQIDYMSLIQDFSMNKFFKFTGNDMEFCNHDHALIPYGNNIFGLYYMPGSGYTLFDDNYLLNTNFPIENRPDTFPIRILKWNQEVYTQHLEDHKGYWSWKNNRNKKRGELEEKYGYDTKHAMHLFRLLRTGKEILTDGIVNVKRPDAKELLDIRNGKYTYNEIVELAEQMDAEIKTLYQTTTLSKRVDVKEACKILIAIQDSIWQRSKN